MFYHQDNDVYYLLNKDEFDQDHYYRLSGKLNKNLHVYPEIDAAILTLDDEFYTNGRKIFQNRDVFLRLSRNAYPLGTDAAVLGYPQELDDRKKVSGVYIENKFSNELRDELIKKRVDRGVVNARYTDPGDNLIKYDFTMAFNPGNSGGPIIDDDCNVIAIVRGYRAFPIKIIEEKYTHKKPNGGKEDIIQPATIRAVYSIGYSSENFSNIISEHTLK